VRYELPGFFEEIEAQDAMQGCARMLINAESTLYSSHSNIFLIKFMNSRIPEAGSSFILLSSVLF
jgi:hypothetical protein